MDEDTQDAAQHQQELESQQFRERIEWIDHEIKSLELERRELEQRRNAIGDDFRRAQKDMFSESFDRTWIGGRYL